ncbi:MAG: beta-lactamase family protein [Deltaproteobacteria bacterium]|nr:beta-lactamase family protein [Deltaproteobacteria bacterium]
MSRVAHLALSAALAHLAACATASSPQPPPRLAAIRLEALNIQKLLSETLQTSGIPGIAAAVVRSEGPVRAAAVGVRSTNGKDPVRLDDPFHIGSCTKSMTATLIALLVEEGRLAWDTPLAKLLPSIAPAMRAVYRHVTIQDLLTHASGLPPVKQPTADEIAFLTGLRGSPRSQREEFARWVLQRAPVFTPGKGHAYSNAGYALLAHIAEVATSRSYEELMRQRVFSPLGLRCFFGWPATPERPHAPHGHWRKQGAFVPLALDDPYRLPPALVSAGDVSCAIASFAEFVRAHLRALRNLEAALPSRAVQALHRARPLAKKMPAKVENYFGETAGIGGGWYIFNRSEKRTVSWHNGSAGTFFTWMLVLPHDDVAIVVATNAGGSEPTIARVAARILDRLMVSR